VGTLAATVWGPFRHEVLATEASRIPLFPKSLTMTLDTTTGASLIAEQGSQILVQPREAASTVLTAGLRIFDSL
jgi:hypothetical protein